MSTLTGMVGKHYYVSPFSEALTDVINGLCETFTNGTEFHEVVLFPFNQTIGIDDNFYRFSLRDTIPVDELDYLSFFFSDVREVGNLKMLNGEIGGGFDILARISSDDEAGDALYIGINYLPENGDNGTLDDLKDRIGEEAYAALMRNVQQFVNDVAEAHRPYAGGKKGSS